MYMLIVLRAGFIILAYFVGLLLARSFPEILPTSSPILVAALAAAVVSLEVVFQQRHLRTVVAVVVGLVAGLIVTAVIIGVSLLFIHEEDVTRLNAIRPFVPLIALFCCYIAVTIVLQTKDQFRFILPYTDFLNYGKPTGGIILDTSTLVDGRIAGLVDQNVIAETIVVPEFVVAELHALADSADHLKRSRGRRGLDFLLHIQGAPDATVRMDSTDYADASGVDVKLVRLAKELDARIATTDINLSKVAMTEGAKVLNMVEISKAMRQVLLPGEFVSLKITEPGDQRGQGRGYLHDGTMVVVEDARQDVGKDIEVTITRPLESAGGQIYFTTKAASGGEKDEPSQGE